MDITQRWQFAALGFMLVLGGCKGNQAKTDITALNHARQQAAVTGVAQRVVYVDEDGNTVTSLVQPPEPGKPLEQITTTKTKPSSSGSR